MQAPPIRTPQFIQLQTQSDEALRAELTAGLLASDAYTSPKYLYDALGSRLFEAITELPEYYPTRTEAAIFRAHLAEMAKLLPVGATLVDLGAGNCEKAARLFEALQPARYVAVDISVDFLHSALQSLQRQHPGLDMLGIGMDFSASLALPPQAGDGPRVLFYPGSSIGNFTPTQALSFLKQVRTTCLGGGLLIGVDLVKPRAVLEPAYGDALGVTAAFNKNLLLHINQIMGSDFQVQDWVHQAFFKEADSRIEMHLQALRDLTVTWPGGRRSFRQHERIHTENSCKYTLAGFEDVLEAAGFGTVHRWQDAQGWFAVFWAQA